MRRELAASRGEAHRLISERRVRVGGIPTPKPASLVAPDTPIELSSAEAGWVSRGAHKLLAALAVFPLALTGKRVLDVGASTGGFTQVALHAGASGVVALDVGRGQLHERLASDPRVVSMERTNFRHVVVEDIGGPFPVVLADLSFISLCTVATKLAEAATEGGDLVVLVKPQFEAGRGTVGKGGVVRDPSARAESLQKVIACLAGAGLGALGVIPSPLPGTGGNIEYLLWLRKGEQGRELEVEA